MQNTVTRQLSRDKMLDYLFQDTVEEQFEAFQALRQIPQTAAEPVSVRTGWMTRLVQWVKGESVPTDPYDSGLDALWAERAE